MMVGCLVKSEGAHILMYHSILSGASKKKDIYQIDVGSFAKQQNIVSNISEMQVVALNDMTGSANELVITFDDGFRDTYELASPILEELNLPFTVFIAPGLIEGRGSKYLTKQLLLSLSKINGCTIGAHGYSHCRLTECDDVKLNNELADSKKWLEDVLGKTVDMMSYPHGAVDIRVRDMVEQVGYKIAASSKAGANISSQDMLQLCRTDIWSLDNCQTFTQKVKGQWDWI